MPSRTLFSIFIYLIAFSVKTIGEESSQTWQVQHKQMDYDNKYFEINEGFEKLRHIMLH